MIQCSRAFLWNAEASPRVGPAMFILVTAAIAGGIITTLSLWNYGAFLAVACAPLGGSLLAIIAASLFSLTRQRTRDDRVSRPESRPARCRDPQP